MAYQTIFIASVLLLLAFGIEKLGRVSGIPSVVALISVGLIGNPVLGMFGVSINGIGAVVPVLGTVGLVLIVLEGALDIELSRERMPLVWRALVLATAGFLVCTAAFGLLLAHALSLDPLRALILAVPFAVISSAVAIPSSVFLPQRGREFVIYESSISDILGVMVFFALLSSDGTPGGILVSLAGGGGVSLILSILCALGLTLIMLRMDGHIRFIPALAGMFALYSAGKLMHLSPLIMILLLGLVLNNATLLARLRPFKTWIDERYPATLADFKLITGELTFAVRGFFFMLLGYWADLATLVAAQAWIAAALVLLIVYGSRHLMLKLAGHELAGPLTWLAPRGLITVLLFLSAKESMQLPAYFDGAVILVVLSTAGLTAVGRKRWAESAGAPQISEGQP